MFSNKTFIPNTYFDHAVEIVSCTLSLNLKKILKPKPQKSNPKTLNTRPKNPNLKNLNLVTLKHKQ
jgi:hypothetical protein